MANFLFTPPAAAVATARVEKATSQLLVGPDWTMNMEICDLINNDQWQAKEVIKALKKRLQNRNPKVQFFTLTLLEALVNNCGDYLHSQVVERDMLQEMMKIVRKKSDMQVKDKILELLDFWQEAFGGPGGKYPQFYWAYVELKRSGVVFPQRSRDIPPIFTRPANPEMTATNLQVGYGMPMRASRRLDEAMASEIGLSDLNRIRSVMELLNDMLQAVNPYDHEAVKDEVITDLVSQCRSNQKKLMQFLGSTGDENLLAQGLEINDSLQNLLAKHDDIASGTVPPEASKSLAKQKMPISHPVASNHLEDEDEDEDDEFAKLARRNSNLKSVTSETESTSNYTSDPFSLSRSDWTASSTSEASSSVASNALVPLDPSTLVATHKDEQVMIDLLSLTLTESPSLSHAHIQNPSTSSQNGPSFSASSTEQDYLKNSQPSQTSQGFTPYNSYVAPWAQYTLPPGQLQPPPQCQPSQYLSNYPPPWNTGGAASNPFSSDTYQFPNSYGNPATYSTLPVYTPSPLQRYNSFGPQVPSPTQRIANLKSIQGHNSFNSRVITPAGEMQHNPTFTPLQQSNSFGSGVTAGPSAGAPPASRKPYYHPDSLFNDLIDFRNPSSRQQVSGKAPSLGTPGQSVINGGK